MNQRRLLPVADARTTVRVARRLLRAQRRWAAATVAAFVLAGLAGLVPIVMIGRIVDTVDAGGDRRTLAETVVVIVVSALIAAVATAVSTAALARAVAPALASLRESVLDRALRLKSARIEEAGVGDVVSRVGDDVRQVTESLDEAVPATLSSITTLIFTIGGLFTLDWRLGLAGLVAAPAYTYAVRWYLPRSAPLYRQERIAQGERAEALVTGVRGAATLRAFAREHDALQRIETTSGRAVDVALDAFYMYTRFGFRMNMSELVGMASILTAGFLTVRAGVATIGEATAAALFFHRLFNPIGALLFLFDTVQSAGAALTRIVGVAELPAPEPGSIDPGERPVLQLSDVRHEYEPGRTVLEPVSLTVDPGRQIAVVGATGAGKTTLGAIASAALRPTGGMVTLGGQDLHGVDESEVRRFVSVVSQEVHVFAGTVRENLLLADPEASDGALMEALEVALAAAWVRSLPRGLDTPVGSNGHPLTAPQAQQLALARVVLRDPAVVVLDEATAEAGSSGARDLERAARRVLTGRSAIVIAHRLTQAQHADMVVVMHDGRIIEHGTHADLIAADGRYARLWRAWSAR